MRLDLGCIHIKDVRFGAKTAIENHALSIDRQELTSLLEQEPLFERVEIELAHPGESCRIIRVLDVLEPRYRMNGPNFPGALDGNGLVGDGRTRALEERRGGRDRSTRAAFAQHHRHERPRDRILPHRQDA